MIFPIFFLWKKENKSENSLEGRDTAKSDF